MLRWAFIPIIFVAIFVRPSWSVESMAAFVIEACGYLFLLGGLVIRIWCTFYIGGQKSKEIIISGPYSLCRNPLYVGTFILSIGAGFCFENLLMLAIVPAIIIPVHVIVVRMEETHLEQIFGEEYRVYKQKVPRFWPNFSNYNSPDSFNVNVNAIRRIALDTLGVLLLPEIEDLLEVLHHHGIVPVLWHFP
ncbi:MAG: hypothetical protein A2Z25_06835 [Planctomycetes bacterium RBG_16_55_9]|nr:MAG: hypothetical protein A2Z25_06835 [Planctomycetes bacterium RBG_16_55_9]